ncbi:MAG: hypothetical protein ACR2LT_06790 [Pyrinomonadaceae bacterium]
MKNRNTQNKRLDDIERKTLNAAILPNEEIEKIVRKPQLFNSVMARIEDEKLRGEQKRDSVNRKIFPIWSEHKIGYSFAVLIILSLAAGILFIRKTPNSAPDLISEKVDTVKLSPAKTVNSSASPDGNLLTTEKTTNYKFNKIFAAKKSIKKENVKIQKSPERKNLTKPLSPPVTIADEKVFYPLTFPTDPAVENGERQIVRTELSRAALFALGVNVAAGGDENRKYKTDLIIGADGVTQAIRFVE